MKKEIKQPTKKEKTMQQISCTSCFSMKLQVFGIEEKQDETLLYLICLDCGLVSNLKILGKAQEIKPIDNESQRGAYFG